MVDIEYSNACTEVLEILKYIPKEDYNKIPKKKIDVLEMDKNIQHIFKYDVKKTLEEQKVSLKAQTIIALFFRDYWATDKQRDIILSTEKQYEIKREEVLREKYNSDNLFKNKKIETNKTVEDFQNDVYKNEMQMVEYKEEKWYKKLFSGILKFFGK